MRYGIAVIGVLLFSAQVGLLAQQLETGAVSYVTAQHVYVKFATTKGIAVGDTLFLKKGNVLTPALVVANKSSISCVCTPLPGVSVQPKDAISAKQTADTGLVPPAKPEPQKPPAPVPAAKLEPENRKPAPASVTPKQRIRARVSAASYSNISDRGQTTRMRYAFVFNGEHLNDSKFSTNAYVTFRHTLGEWSAVQDNLNNALKVYGLSATYHFNETTSLSAGRGINPKITNLGAVDGLQFETGFGHFYTGVLAGARPNLFDYSFDADLLQAGAYVGFGSKAHERHHQSTLGVVEQRNKSAVDRRFVYFQHSDELLENLNLFGSMEMDLYQLVNSEASMQPSLTNLFASLRYRFSRNWNLSLSYDNRKNIIYYESYKTYLDQLIDQETRQGLRLGMNMRPAKWLSCGLTGSWRFQKSKANDAKNLNSYLNFNRIPLLKASATLTANYLQSGYLNGTTFGLRLMKDIFKGKLNLELSYRRVDYTFPFYGYSTNQNIVGGSLTWSIFKKLGFYVFVENTFDSQGNDYLLVNTKLMQRF